MREGENCEVNKNNAFLVTQSPKQLLARLSSQPRFHVEQYSLKTTERGPSISSLKRKGNQRCPLEHRVSSTSQNEKVLT